MTLSERFVEWSTGLEPTPPEVCGTAKRHVLDAIGTGPAAPRLGVVDFVVAEATRYGTPAESGILGYETRHPAPMAARGATGPATIPECGWGLYRSYADTTVEPDEVTATLGKEWETTRMTVEPYRSASTPMPPSIRRPCYPTISIRAVSPASIADSPRTRCWWSPSPERPTSDPAPPTKPSSACSGNVATLLIDGDSSIDHFREEQLAREDVRDLAAMVFVHRGPFDGPLAEAPGDVRITLHGGETITRSVSCSSASPDRPRDEGAVVDKFASNVAVWVEDAEGIAKLVIEDGGLPVKELMSMTGRR